MARTIQTIKEAIAADFTANETVRTLYGIDGNWRGFSSVSVENLLFHTVAVAIHLLERIFDTHLAEVDSAVKAQKPHTLRWYVEKARQFRIGHTLTEGADTYSDTGYTPDQIAEAQIVHFAAAQEDPDTHCINLKVATTQSRLRAPLSAYQLDAFTKYITDVKDAGVPLNIISMPGCHLRARITIYCDPLVINSTNGANILNPEPEGENNIETAIKQYMENLPFNGVFMVQQLIDRLQAVEGVVTLTADQFAYSNDGNSFTPFTAYHNPYSGFYQYERDNLTINYENYQSTTA